MVWWRGFQPPHFSGAGDATLSPSHVHRHTPPAMRGAVCVHTAAPRPDKFFIHQTPSTTNHHYYMTNTPPHKHHRTAPKEDAVFLGVREGDTLVFYCPNCRKHHRHGWAPATPLWSLTMRVSHCKDPRTPWMYWIGISKDLQKMMKEA